MESIKHFHFIPARRTAVVGGRFWVIVVALLLLAGSHHSLADETNASPPAAGAGGLQDTNAQEVLRAILALEDQIRSNQIAIEQNGKEAKLAAAQNAELFSKGMHGLQETLSSQQQANAERSTRELQAMQNSNRVVVLIGGIFAAVVALTLLLIVYFQWRISKVWTQISRLLQLSRGTVGVTDARVLGPSDSGATPAGLAEASNARLLHAVEELETRVQGLEQHSGPAPGGHTGVSEPGNGDPGVAIRNLRTTTAPELKEGNAPTQIAAWLGQGQTMLKQNDFAGALQCFDEVLARDPNHSEALVKKGAALERMKKLNEAFECYDRAIAADESMTVAYLHKGGLCSRLERFKEALECYEKALRTHND